MYFYVERGYIADFRQETGDANGKIKLRKSRKQTILFLHGMIWTFFALGRSL